MTVSIDGMEAKNADLAALRINRSSEPASAAPPPRGRVPRWLTIGVPAGVILALVGVSAARAARLDIVSALRAS